MSNVFVFRDSTEYVSDSSSPSDTIEQILSTVTLIRYPNAEGHATGFFYNYNNRGYPFLITCLHSLNVEDRAGNQVDSVRISTRKSTNVEELNHHDVPLFDDGGDPIWITHPNEPLPNKNEHFPENPKIDLAAIPLPECGVNLGNTGTKTLSPDHFLPDDHEILPGQRAIIMGYPYRTTAPQYPIIRAEVS